TSRSRMATMPWLFRLRMWLPAMPTKAEWMRQPAISCASSMARWIDCTVDSMFTTTPFFRPRDGLVPMPTISSSPSAVTSPTSATTLEVPMSRPTIILPLCTLAMILTVLLDSLDGNRRFGRRRRHRLTPRHGQAVGIAQVDTRNVRNLRSERLVVDAGETPHLVHQMIPPQQNVHALSRADEPAAVLAQLQA